MAECGDRGAALVNRKYERHEAHRHEQHVQRVEMRVNRRRPLLDIGEAQSKGDEQERQKNHENPPPRHVCADQSADRRTERRRRRHNQAADTHQLTDTRFWRLIKNDIEHQRQGDTRTTALENAGEHQHREIQRTCADNAPDNT